MKKTLFICCLFMSVITTAQQLVIDKLQDKSFSLSNTVIYVDANEVALVKKSAELLQQDIEMVTGIKPEIINRVVAYHTDIIVIGTITSSSFLKEIIEKKLVNIKGIENKWEAFHVQGIDASPVFSPVEHMLVIAGSDRRGVAFGVFEFSKQIGVSPWYWWADVPVKKKAAIYIKKEVIVTDAPKVKYRGIFINDEAPALSNWSKKIFGGFNHLFYEKVFELMLRLKANYLWPAMWGNAFYDDDSLNIRSADEYGIYNPKNQKCKFL